LFGGNDVIVASIDKSSSALQGINFPSANKNHKNNLYYTLMLTYLCLKCSIYNYLSW
jgi:hypothetical protein